MKLVKKRFKISIILFIVAIVLIENIAYHNPFYKPSMIIGKVNLFYKIISIVNFPISIFSYYMTYLFGYAYLLTPILLLILVYFFLRRMTARNIKKLISIYWGILNLLLLFYILSYFIKEKIFINNIPYYGKIIYILAKYLKRLGGTIFVIIFTFISYFEYLLYVLNKTHKEFLNLIKIFLKKGRRVNKYNITNNRKAQFYELDNKAKENYSVENDYYGEKKSSNDIGNDSKLNSFKSEKAINKEKLNRNNIDSDIKIVETSQNKYVNSIDDSVLSKNKIIKLKSFKKIGYKESNKSFVEKDHSYTIKNFLEKLNINYHFKGIKEVSRFSIYLFYISNYNEIQRLKKNKQELEYKLYPLKLNLFIPFQDSKLIGFAVSKEKFKTYHFIENFESDKCKNDCTIFIGEKITSEPFYFDIPAFPHLLIAGATGSGKSVFLNTLILSLLFQKSSYYTKLILIDPKKVEFEIYKNIPNLAYSVITEINEASNILNQLSILMEKRYSILASKNIRNIKDYNNAYPDNKISYLITIIDEFGDLILSDKTGSIRENLIKLAQKARAVGIHIVIATQRPSAKIIDGLIKANFPVKVAFKTSSKIDSRIVLDNNGAESLLGKGDMIFKHPETGFLRLQSPFISTEEIIQLLNKIQ